MTREEEAELERLIASLPARGGARGPRPIAEILSRLMARRGYGNQQTQIAWSEAWARAAGGQAEAARPGKFQRGILEIVVRNSIALQEFTFQKKQLLQRIQEQVPRIAVRDLRFRVGEID